MKCLQRSMQLKRSFVFYSTQKLTKTKSASNDLWILSQAAHMYVVDLDCLQHPDVKKDNFGVWTHSGSHTHQFLSCINQGKVEIGRSVFSSDSPKWERFSLRRLHSKHPTNPSFCRVISFITGT